MAKIGFIKTIKKSVSLNKLSNSLIFILLLFVVIIIFFLMFNKSIENFTCAKDGYTLEVIHWTREDAPNEYAMYTLINWPKFVRENYLFENIIIEDRDYALANQYVDKTENTQLQNVDFTNKDNFPMVTYFVQNKATNKRKYFYHMNGGMLSQQNENPYVWTTLVYNAVRKMNYSSLFTTADKCTV